MYFLMRKSKPISLFIWGCSYRKEFAPIGEQILSFKSTPQIQSDTVRAIKVKNKNDFLIESMENYKMSGKNQGKVQEF